VRVEFLPRAEAPLDAVARADLEPVQSRVAERRRHQVIRLEERAVRAGAFQSQALEPRSDVVGRDAVLFSVGEPPAQRIAREKEEIRAQIFLADRSVVRRRLLRDMDRRGHAHRGDKMLLHASDYAPETKMERRARRVRREILTRRSCS